jgi:hypothetical protein
MQLTNQAQDFFGLRRVNQQKKTNLKALSGA